MGHKLVQIRLVDVKDYQRWDAYVRTNSDAGPYHLMAWSLAIGSAYKHQQFGLIAERNEKICGVLPICHLVPPMNKGNFCSLPFCDYGGVLGEDSDIEEKLVNAALRLAQEHRVTSVDLRNQTRSVLQTEMDSSKKVSMLLELPKTADDLFAGFKSKLRSQVRKAKKNGLEFYSGTDHKILTQFYQVLSSNMRDLGSPVHSFDWFNSIREQFKDDMIIGVVSIDEAPVGAGMLLFLEDKAVIPWASTLANFNYLAPNMLLYWNMLMIAVERRCTIFDFGRSSYGEGTYRFKRQWGAVPVLLDWKTYYTDGEVMEDCPGESRLKYMFKVVWRRLPLWLANVLGPYIRKYISL